MERPINLIIITVSLNVKCEILLFADNLPLLQVIPLQLFLANAASKLQPYGSQNYLDGKIEV